MSTQQMSRNGQHTAEGTSASQKTSRRKALLPLFFVLAALLLSACSDWQGTGVVTGKSHTDGYTYMTTICVGYDSKSNCTVSVPQFNEVPDYWYVEVADSTGAKHTVSVSKDYFNSAKNGDAFDNTNKK